MTVYDPPVGFHFSVTFDLPGATASDIRFRDVAGLTMELEEFSYAEGGENRFSHRLPVRGRYPDLVLKRGLLLESGLRGWIRDAVQNLVVVPVTVWVKLLGPDHQPLQSWVVTGAWPKKWSVSDLSAESSALVIESLELAYRYFRVE